MKTLPINGFAAWYLIERQNNNIIGVGINSKYLKMNKADITDHYKAELQAYEAIKCTDIGDLLKPFNITKSELLEVTESYIKYITPSNTNIFTDYSKCKLFFYHKSKEFKNSRIEFEYELNRLFTNDFSDLKKFEYIIHTNGALNLINSDKRADFKDFLINWIEEKKAELLKQPKEPETTTEPQKDKENQIKMLFDKIAPDYIDYRYKNDFVNFCLYGSVKNKINFNGSVKNVVFLVEYLKNKNIINNVHNYDLYGLIEANFFDNKNNKNYTRKSLNDNYNLIKQPEATPPKISEIL